MHVEKDRRIRTDHICVYMALFQHWNLNGFKNPFAVTRTDILKWAKIKPAAYPKCLKELSDFGYISYTPFHHPVFGRQLYVEMFLFKTEVPGEAA